MIEAKIFFKFFRILLLTDMVACTIMQIVQSTARE